MEIGLITSLKRLLIVVTISLLGMSNAYAEQKGTAIKTNQAGMKLEITAWTDGLRRWKYAVTDPSNRQKYYWYAQGGSANAEANNAPHPTSHDDWCRVRALYGDSVHVPECNGKFLYKSYVITGLNNKHYEIWFRPGSISYYKLREQETGIWYAHDGSRNDGFLNTTKEDWCRIIIFHGNGIIRAPKACDDVMKNMTDSAKGLASQSVQASELAAMAGMMQDGVDLAMDPKGFVLGKVTGNAVEGFKSEFNLHGTNAAGKIAEIGGTAAVNTAIMTALTAGGPASALAGLAVSVAVSGAQALAEASKDTTLHMYDGYETHARFDLDLSGISTSYAPPVALPGTRKWADCGGENQACNFAGTKLVRYGANGHYRYLWARGTTTCSYTNFGGDPAPGVHKRCSVAGSLKSSALLNGKGLCLDAVSMTAHKNGGNVQVYQCLGNAYQKWTRRGDTLVNGKGLCLDANSPTAHQNGGNVLVWECSGSDFQKWTRNGNMLVNGKGLCLDANSPTAHQNGGNVIVWQCGNSAYQSWKRD